MLRSHSLVKMSESCVCLASSQMVSNLLHHCHPSLSSFHLVSFGRSIWDRPVASYEVGFLLPPLHRLSIVGDPLVPRTCKRVLKSRFPNANLRLLASKQILFSLFVLLVAAWLYVSV